MGRSATVWKHFDKRTVKNARVYYCKATGCTCYVSNHPRYGYKHIRMCSSMPQEEKKSIIDSVMKTDKEEVLKYEEFWNPYFNAQSTSSSSSSAAATAASIPDVELGFGR